MLAALIPCGILLLPRARSWMRWWPTRRSAPSRSWSLILLAEGFRRPGEFELPVLLAVLLFGSGLVFVRLLERWL